MVDRILYQLNRRLYDQRQAEIVVAHPVLRGSVEAFEAPVVVDGIFWVEGFWIRGVL